MRARALYLVASCLLVVVMLGTAGQAPRAIPGDVLPETIVVGPGVIPLAISASTPLAHESYLAALRAPEVLASVPCTCGCMNGLDHASNLDCYIDQVHADGVVTFTTHGIGCGICQLITRDAVAGAAAGMTGDELTEMVMQRYGPRQH